MGARGRVERIWVKRAHEGPMDEAEVATLEPGKGIVGNADTGGRRQVTLVALDRWRRAEEELGAEVDPSLRRANVLVSGIELVGPRDRTVRIGSCRLLVHGETPPCAVMDAQHQGLRAALEADWGGGAYGEVLDAGEIRVGDPVEWVDAS